MNYGADAPGACPEVSGVLLGRREGSRLHIVAFRPIALLAEEEGVVFSDDWERAFGGLVARVRWDPKLAGLQLAGWFRAHPKTSLNLSRRDLQIFNRFFREPWQIGVILQPQERSAHGRFFVKEANAAADAYNGHDVMVRWSALNEVKMPAARAAAPLPAEMPVRRDPQGKRPFWPAVVVAAAVAGTAWWIFQPPAPTAPTARPAPEASRDLNTDTNPEAAQQAQALWKKWESEARQQNGTPTPPEPDPLRDATTDQPVRDLAKPASPVPPSTQTASALPREQPRAQEPDRKSQTAAPRKPWVPPAAAAVPASRAVIESPPPTLSATVQPDGNGRNVYLPPTAVPAPPPRPVVRETARPPAPPPVPSSGRVIWTGHVRKNDLIVFENGKASTGSLSGALPGVPVRVTVSPGDLTKDGMTVYTARLRGSNGPPEAAGPENGWNKTMYLWDPGRTADFEVTEAPNPKNGWKRLVLRAKNAHDSIVMVEWNAQQQ